MAEQVYWEDVAEGQEIPSFFRKTDLMNWNRWASVNDEYVPMHMDDDAARENGQPAAFGQGPLRFSYLHSLLRQFAGDDGEVVLVRAQMRGINFKHDELTCTGKVTGEAGGGRASPRRPGRRDHEPAGRGGNAGPGDGGVALAGVGARLGQPPCWADRGPNGSGRKGPSRAWRNARMPPSFWASTMCSR